MSKQFDLSFACPKEMRPFCENVFAGEYDIAFVPEAGRKLVILDIGANCGAFSLWADCRWPHSSVFAYEPAQVNYPFLQENTKAYGNIETKQLAVTEDATYSTRKLYCGMYNQGEASLFPDLGQTTDTYEEVRTVNPADLPQADIIKVDTEGCELQIVRGLLSAGQTPEVFLLEYHSEEDRRELDATLEDYELWGSWSTQPHRGVVKYRKKEQ